MTNWSDERRQNLLCSREKARLWRRRISPRNFGGDPSIASPRAIRRPLPKTSTYGHECGRFESGGASFAARKTVRVEGTYRLSLQEARTGTPRATHQCCGVSRPTAQCALLPGFEPIRSRAYGSRGEVQRVWQCETVSTIQANSAKTQLDTQVAAGCRPRAWSPVLFVVPRMNESGGP